MPICNFALYYVRNHHWPLAQQISCIAQHNFKQLLLFCSDSLINTKGSSECRDYDMYDRNLKRTAKFVSSTMFLSITIAHCLPLSVAPPPSCPTRMQLTHNDNMHWTCWICTQVVVSSFCPLTQSQTITLPLLQTLPQNLGLLSVAQCQ